MTESSGELVGVVGSAGERLELAIEDGPVGRVAGVDDGEPQAHGGCYVERALASDGGEELVALAEEGDRASDGVPEDFAKAAEGG